MSCEDCLFLGDDGNFYCSKCHQDVKYEQNTVPFTGCEFCELSFMKDQAPLTVIKSDTHPYAFTLRKTSKKDGRVTKDMYHKRMGDIQKLGIEVPDYVFEYEAGLHSHGVMNIPVKFNLKRLRVRGWNILVNEITDLKGWKRYMSKYQSYSDPDIDPDIEGVNPQLFSRNRMSEAKV